MSSAEGGHTMDHDKINLGRDVRINPMVIGLIGSQVNGKANFITVGQVYRLNMSPAYIGTSIHPTHYTAGGIREHKAFSVNIPHCGMAEVTDYCGIVSGKKHDKSTLFELFYGELGEVAPMIVDPMNGRVSQNLIANFAGSMPCWSDRLR